MPNPNITSVVPRIGRTRLLAETKWRENEIQ